MEPKNMNLFIDMVKERAAEYHWESTILMIPVIKGATVTGTHNLIDKYGELSIQDVQTQALTWATSDNRSRQDSHMFYTMLRKSLTPEALTVVANMAAQYTIEGHADGPLLFKCILTRSHVDTRATSTVIRMNLSSLDHHISTINYNITTFNEYVRSQQNSLASRGEVTQDLLVNLFKAYQVVPDREFSNYINRYQDKYDDGEDVPPETLMLRAENKYKSLLERDSWNAQSSEEKKIVALTAQIEDLKKVKLQLAKKYSKNNKDDKEKDTKKDKDKDKKKDNKENAWKAKKPADDAPHTKKVKGVDWIWCPTHQRWGQHKPAECRKKKSATEGQDKSPSAQNSDETQDKKVSFSSHINRILESKSE